MYIAVDAIANEDDAKLSYLMFPYDEDFLDAIEENLKEIRVENEITFSLDDVLLIRGEFHYVRKKVTMTDISEHRYCIARNTEKIPQLQNSKLHVANDYFYFSGYRKPINRHEKANVMFVSENFNLVTIENLRKYVKSKKAMVE
jgi:hypothetical protein